MYAKYLGERTMSNAEDGDTQLRSQELDDLVASTDTGGRTPDSRFVMMLLSGLALAWAVWQVWIASPVSYQIGWGVFSSKEARPIHLAFAIFLAYLAYPATKRSPRHVVPILDWVLASLGALCTLYLFAFDSALSDTLFGSRLSDRPGNPNSTDIVVACGRYGVVARGDTACVGAAPDDGCDILPHIHIPVEV